MLSSSSEELGILHGSVTRLDGNQIQCLGQRRILDPLSAKHRLINVGKAAFFPSAFGDIAQS